MWEGLSEPGAPSFFAATGGVIVVPGPKEFPILFWSILCPPDLILFIEATWKGCLSDSGGPCLQDCKVLGESMLSDLWLPCERVGEVHQAWNVF